MISSTATHYHNTYTLFSIAIVYQQFPQVHIACLLAISAKVCTYCIKSLPVYLPDCVSVMSICVPV